MEDARKLQELITGNLICIGKIFLITIPVCVGTMLWYTITLRPSLGLWSVGMTCMSAYYKKICVFRDAEVVHLFNEQDDLDDSMRDYLEHEERNQAE